MTISFEDACTAVHATGTLFELAEGEIDGNPTTLFANCPPSISALFAMAAAREDDFIIYEDERWAMPKVLSTAAGIGSVLVENYGVEKGDRVAIAMRNYPEWIASFAAIVSIGAVAVPLNAWWQTEEFGFAVGDAEPKVIITDAARLEKLTEAGVEAQLIVVRSEGDLPANAAHLADILVAGATMPQVEVGPDDNATILYTSGTTGRPKGAVSSHRAVLSALLAFAARAQVAALREPATDEEAAASEGTQTCFMLCVPLFHVTGLIPVMLGSFVGGSKLVMTHKWEPNRALELIEAEKVTHFVGVPTMSWDLLEASTFADRDTSSLVSVGGGGAPMPPELVKRIDDNFPNGKPGLGYGMTETNAYGPQNTGADFVANPTSTGKPVPVMKMRVTDPDGNGLPVGETGEIWFSGPTLIKGYWNRPDATAETLVDGWLRSGDIGRLDDDGWVYVSDRAKDMVLRGGENIYCAEVEASIYEHPAVYEVAVYGIPDERLGEELACHVMVKDGESLDAAELQAFVGQRLAKFKVPSVVTIVSESLPRNASGKILKRELRDSVIG